MHSPAGSGAGRGAETRAARRHARGLLLGAVLLLCGSRLLHAGDTDGMPACARILRALDESGRPMWQTIAVALPERGRAAAPLHVLERGGRRFDRLQLSDAAGWIEVDSAAAVTAEANLVVFAVLDLDACGERGMAGDAGTPVRVVRERVGYRSAVIGGRVERRVSINDGGTVTLLRLLDDRGADPGLVFDEQHRFLGATLPAPPAAKASLAALAPAPDHTIVIDGAGTATAAAGGTPTAGAATFPAPRATPSASVTAAGYVARALLDDGPGAGERGIDLLGEAMRRTGPSAALLVERGVRAFAAGRIAPAIDDFRAAAVVDPASHLARYNLGLALGMSGLYADAAAALEEAHALDPGHGRTLYQLVLALSAAHRNDDARREYQALVALDPVLARDLESIPGL